MSSFVKTFSRMYPNILKDEHVFLSWLQINLLDLTSLFERGRDHSNTFWNTTVIVIQSR